MREARDFFGFVMNFKFWNISNEKLDKFGNPSITPRKCPITPNGVITHRLRTTEIDNALKTAICCKNTCTVYTNIWWKTCVTRKYLKSHFYGAAKLQNIFCKTLIVEKLVTTLPIWSLYYMKYTLKLIIIV